MAATQPTDLLLLYLPHQSLLHSKRGGHVVECGHPMLRLFPHRICSGKASCSFTPFPPFRALSNYNIED